MNQKAEVMKKLNYFIFTLMFGVLLHLNILAQHFQTVWSNNPYMPMSIFVDSARLDSVYLQANDEIAVFDVDATGDEICVGVIVLSGEFLPDDNYMINASADDPTTPDQDGFIDGHTIIFRFWDNSAAVEITLFVTVYNSEMVDVYEDLGTALVGLDGYYALIWTGEADYNWHNAANWHIDNLIPDSGIRVLIPSWCTVVPQISTSNAACKKLKLEQGTSLSVSGTYNLQVND